MIRKVICFITAAVLLFMQSTGVLSAGEHKAPSDEYEELIQYAEISTDIPIREGSYLDNIRDAMWGSILYGKEMISDYIEPEDEKFPYYIEFDFGTMQIELAYMVLYGYYTDTTGVTGFDIQYWNGSEWELAEKGAGEEWGNGETRIINTDMHPVSTKFRFVINKARMSSKFFRIWEMEIYGKALGYTDINNVKAVKTDYYRLHTGEKLPSPDYAYILTDDNSEKCMQVFQKETAAADTEGLYYSKNKLIWLDNEAGCIADVYNPDKYISGMTGHWAEKNIKYAVRNGWLGSIAAGVGDKLTRTDTAKIIWRALNIGTEYIKSSFTDTVSDTAEYEIINSLRTKGAYQGIADDIFGGDTVVSRLEAVRCIVNLIGADRTAEVSFSDADKESLEILKKAYYAGIISDGTEFRPNEPVTLSELITMLVSADNHIVVRDFTDTKEPLINPGMGMFSYMVDSGGLVYDTINGADELFEDIPGVSTIYVRMLWNEVNPAEGVYDFSYIDALIEKYSKLGKQVALRVVNFEGYEWAAPKWVYDNGAKQQRWDYSTPTGRFAEYNNDPDVLYTAPDYDDPVFTQYETQFYEEFGRRYNGNPNIAYIDMGFGLWGEGHTGRRTPSFSFDAIIYRMELLRRCFPDTKLVILNELESGVGYDRVKWEQIKAKAEELGMGYRNDTYYGSIGMHGSYMFQSIERRDAAEMSEYGPVIMELDHYKNYIQNKFDEDGIGIGKTIQPHHASYMGIHGHLYQQWEENSKFFEYCYLNLGYRIIPERISVSGKTTPNGKISLSVQWKNLGSAHAYDDYYPILTLRSENGDIALVQTDTEFNIKNLEPAPIAGDSTIVDGKNRGIVPIYNENVTFGTGKGIAPGEYKVYISLGTSEGEPKLYMPVSGHNGYKEYYIGNITVEEDAE